MEFLIVGHTGLRDLRLCLAMMTYGKHVQDRSEGRASYRWSG